MRLNWAALLFHLLFGKYECVTLTSDESVGLSLSGQMLTKDNTRDISIF